MTTHYPPIPTRASKAAIQRATEKYLKTNALEPGFSLESLVHALGGRITYKENLGSSRSAESIVVTAKKNFVIHLAANTSPLRDRFTIAHELGHYLLHYPLVQEQHGPDSRMIATRFVDDSSQELVRAEWEANWFAASLLMPEAEFRAAYFEDRDIDSIALRFMVTSRAARVRAESLNLA